MSLIIMTQDFEKVPSFFVKKYNRTQNKAFHARIAQNNSLVRERHGFTHQVNHFFSNALRKNSF